MKFDFLNTIKRSKVFLLFFTIFWLFGCTQENKNSHVNKTGYAKVNCGKLFYQKFGSGEPIVILHGGPGHLDHTYLLPQMLELAKDYELIFYDQRGSGRSLDAKISSDYVNLDRFADDLEELRHALKLKKVTLIGHSFGGILAMHYAAKHPEAIFALILLNSAPANYSGVQKFISELIKRRKYIENEIPSLSKYEELEKSDSEQISKMFEILFSVYFYNPKNVELLTLKMDKASVLSGSKVANEMSKTVWLNPNFNLLSPLKHFQAPTLIIHGDQDPIPISAAQDIENTIPESTAVYLEHCGHFPYIEKPDELFKAIRSFLNNIK